jgi:hypothetical protein
MYCIFKCFQRKISDEEQAKINYERIKMLPLYKKSKYFRNQ